MTLLRTAFLGFIATVTQLIAGLVINKAIALYIGASGLALIGQFRDFSQLALTLAQGGINTGLIKYTAEYQAQAPEKLPILLSTARKIVLFCTLTVSLLTALTAPWLAEYLLQQRAHQTVFWAYSLTIFAFVSNNFIISLMSGSGSLRQYISISLLQSLYSLFATTVLIRLFGLQGAFIATIFNQVIVFTIVYLFLRKHPLLQPTLRQHPWSASMGRALLGLGSLSLLSAILSPLFLTAVRQYLVQHFSLQAAGLWQGMFYLSLAYCGVANVVMNNYFLPKYASVTTRADLWLELKRGLYQFLPLLAFIFSLLYYWREGLIHALFSPDFYAITEFVAWYLLGDLCKIAATLSTTLITARNLVRLGVITEISGYILQGGLIGLATHYNGLIGVAHAHLAYYVLYLLYGAWILRYVTRYQLRI